MSGECRSWSGRKMILGEHAMDLRTGRRRESTASSRRLVLAARNMASCFSCTPPGFIPIAGYEHSVICLCREDSCEEQHRSVQRRRD